jgi:hypothetical protein
MLVGILILAATVSQLDAQWFDVSALDVHRIPNYDEDGATDTGCMFICL